MSIRRPELWLLLCFVLFAYCSPLSAQKKPKTLELQPDPDFDEPKTPTKPKLFQKAMLRGSVVTKFQFDTRIDNQFEDVFGWENKFNLSLTYQFRPTIKARIDARMAYWVVGEGNEKNRFYLFNSENVKWEYEVELREAYLDFRWKWFRMTIGNQVVRWGQTDSQSPLDVINPTDFREGVPTDFETPLVPIFAVNLQATYKMFGFQVLWAPFFMPHRMNIFGTDFAMARQGGGTPLEPMLKQISTVIDPSIEDKIQSVLQATKIPDEHPKNSSIGGRITATFGPVDLGLSYYYGWDRFPVFRIDPDLAAVLASFDGQFNLTPAALAQLQRLMSKDPSTLLVSEYRRQHVAGFDFSWAIDPVTIKADLAFFHKRTLYDKGLNPLRKPAITTSLGVEWQHSDWITLSVEFTHMHVFGLDAGVELFTFAENYMVLFGLFRISFLDDNALQFQVSGMFGINDRDWIISGNVRYKITDEWSIAVGVVFFEGPQDSTAGMYDNNDNIYIQGKFSF